MRGQSFAANRDRAGRYGRPDRLAVPARGATPRVLSTNTTAVDKKVDPVASAAPITSPENTNSPVSMEPKKLPTTPVYSRVGAKTQTNITAPKTLKTLKTRPEPQSASKTPKSAVSSVGKTQNIAQKSVEKQKTINKNSALRRRNQKLARAAKMLAVMEDVNTARAPKQAKIKAKKARSHRKKGLFKGGWQVWVPQMAAFALIAVALYTIADTIITNNRVKSGIEHTINAAGDNPESRQAAEGKDETPISNETIAKYTVAPDLPRTIRINKAGVYARVLQMGVNTDGSMQSPINAFDAGWYTGSVRPGQQGAAVVVAHASGPTREGLFAYLDKLKAGDEIQIERGDKTVLKYEVVKVQTAKLSDVDMNAFMRPSEGVSEGLNLMTCAGEWLKDSNTRDQRVMVFAKRV